MTDLLVSSLMADGGLEAALMAAIKVEVQDLENIFFEKELKDKDTNEEEPLMTEQAQMESESKRYHFRFVDILSTSFLHFLKFFFFTFSLISDGQSRSVSNIPLMLLVKQLLKNCGFHATTSLRNQALDSQNHSNLNLLLRFQRLLFVQLFNNVDNFFENKISGTHESDEEQGKLSLLKKYMNLLSSHVTEILPLATSLAQVNDF